MDNSIHNKNMIELPTLQGPPLKRNVQKDVDDEPSPMDPPGPYSPPAREEMAASDFAAPLKLLFDEHEDFLKVLSAFDQAMISFKEAGWRFTPEISAAFKTFFHAMDSDIADHTRKEEKTLFPLLHQKLMDSGEHSPSVKPVTPVDVMEADHSKVEQSTNLVFNLLGLASRIRHDESRNLIFEHAFHEGQEIVEVMKLHIFKENSVLFPLAQKLISKDEFVEIMEKMERV